MLRRYSISAFILALVLTAFAQSKDPLLGTWELDRGKSDFQPDNTMQSRTLIVEAKGNAISVSQKTTAQDGHASFVDFTAGYDSKDVPISGSALDTVALKRLNASTVERTGKIHGQAVEAATMSLSPDNKTLTITTKGTLNNIQYASTQIFERQ